MQKIQQCFPFLVKIRSTFELILFILLVRFRVLKIRITGLKPMSALAEIASLIGPSAAEWLQQNYAGRRIHVPCSIHADHHLAPLGDQAQALAYYWGGCRIKVPMGTAQKVADRDERIAWDFAQGMPVGQLCEKYEVARRTVFYSLERAKLKYEKSNYASLGTS